MKQFIIGVGKATQKASKHAFLVGITTLTMVASCSILNRQSGTKQPNIVVIVADDMGLSDMGAYGGEIDTPNLDAFAEGGIMFTNFHSAATCSPTRAMLLTGVYNHRVGLGTMAWSISRSDNQRGKPGYEALLNNRAVTISTLLNDAGYDTYMVGKWHLGWTEAYHTEIEKERMIGNNWPIDRGFTRSFGILEGAADHYGDRRFHPNYHLNFFTNDRAIEREELPEDFYATKDYTDTLIKFIETDRNNGKPFFAYLAYTASHDPFQAPEEYIQKYLKTYEAGWDKIRSQRFQRMQELGVIPDYIDLPPRWKGVEPWDQLTPDDRANEAKTMAAYAAMLDYMDGSIGRLVDYLKEIGEYENTIFIFFSDNGPESLDVDRSSHYVKWFEEEGVDNSYENMGLRNSFVTKGLGWAQVSATPFWGAKGTQAEGGIRVPMVVYAPGAIDDGEMTDAFATVMDLAPTLLEYGNARHPGTNYKGREVYSMDGKSMKPFLEGKTETIYDEDEPVGFELFGHTNKALIMGDWKITRIGGHWGDGTWKLYHIGMDPRELHDLSELYPQQLEQMLKLYEQYERDVGFVPQKAPK